ncbi:hypothetical protein ROJ8625_00210 [Roseivivax jejudonensis]|uniref:Uncharacterized protein n=1 Tax=Roseivivax jejudonensis TaxID=1529041 RepID=A0A1X6Y4N0_9RHOB|nr:hypothetical protein [Roseivivax jejudonensis]SLN10396.1 hypothetical protein ROJ8625_00210 [Roseivivax jejudonensis]
MAKIAPTPPTRLATARTQAHAAVQLLYRAAVANLAAQAGDAHTNLAWDRADMALATQPLGRREVTVGLRMSPLTLRIGDAELALDRRTASDALAWLDDRLADVGLRSARSTAVTYDLPTAVAHLHGFEDDPGLIALAEWFDLADTALHRVAKRIDAVPGPSPVRCWPHHFDIASYVALEDGDPEEARGIGIGLSPGDAAQDQPYFYVTPWPRPPVHLLPEAIPPGRWHRGSFVGLVASASDLTAMSEIHSASEEFLERSVAIARELLGA